jgi:ribosome recycling factor
MNEVIKDVEGRMNKAIEAFKGELAKLRTGRATLAIVDGIMVDYYGSPTPLNQVASLSVPDSSTIVIAPWETKVLTDIEKAILKSNLGMTPTNDGKVVRLSVPPLTEDRRKELVKLASQIAENSRNAVRQVRRDGNEQLRDKEKSKEISEDQMHDGQGQVQKLTDAKVAAINDILKAKEHEIMEV